MPLFSSFWNIWEEEKRQKKKHWKLLFHSLKIHAALANHQTYTCSIPWCLCKTINLLACLLVYSIKWTDDKINPNKMQVDYFNCPLFYLINTTSCEWCDSSYAYGISSDKLLPYKVQNQHKKRCIYEMRSTRFKICASFVICISLMHNIAQ